MLVWNVLHYLIRMIMRDLGFKEKKYPYLMGPANLDQPINKFIIDTTMFAIFYIFLIISINVPLQVRMGSSNEVFQWYHIVLGIFTLSMPIGDISLLTSSKTFSSSFKFWHVYDVTMHIILTF